MENLEFSMSVTFFYYLDHAIYSLWLWLEHLGLRHGDLEGAWEAFAQRRMLRPKSNIAAQTNLAQWI